MRKVGIVVFASLIYIGQNFGQNTFSPYTINGIGDLSGQSLTNQFAMGEVGIGTPSVWNINHLNPALLPYNRFSAFQLGIAGESRSVASETQTQRSGTAGLSSMVFAFPIKDTKWTTSLGFMPLSSVNYNVLSESVVEGTDVPIAFNFTGEGGLTEVFFSNGFKISEGLTAGIQTSFVFGFIENETVTDLQDPSLTTPLASALFQKTDYRGFKISGGLAYRKKLADKRFFNVGLVFKNSTDLNTTRLVRLERQRFTGAAIPGDTLVNNAKGTFSLPSEIGIGFSYEFVANYLISLDVKRQNWTQFASSEANGEEYRSSLTIGAGMEFIPDYTSVSSYFKRIRYRFGLNYQQLPYVINGNTINDFGINFGWSLPFNNVSGIDFAFKLGQRGTKSNDLIRERYFKFIFGATINDRWFIRRRYN